MMTRILMVFVVFVVVTGVPALVLRRLYPTLWDRALGRLFLGSLVVTGASVAALAASMAFDLPDLRGPAMTVTALLLATSTVLFLSLPIWGPMGFLANALAPGAPAEPDPSRRRFLRTFAGAMPVTAAATGPVGTVASLQPPVIREVRIPVRDLPAALEGLKILQLTDVHLGTFIDVDQVEAAVEAARPYAPDLVVLTGDISDDFGKLPRALDVVAGLGAPLGAFACIGNHEIYRGRKKAEAIYAKSPVRLLCGDGVLLERGDARLWLCGSDDPARLGGDHRTYLETSVQKALEGCPDDVGCRVVLSHRPEGFEAAARRGATLTLSGHTHGAQASLFGRSWLEWAAPRAYLLGHYQSGESHLYTSAGLGHWFPFRLNCPCEAVVLTLARA